MIINLQYVKELFLDATKILLPHDICKCYEVMLRNYHTEDYNKQQIHNHLTYYTYLFHTLKTMSS